MNLNLSMAMVITVSEDMKAATQGMVRISLEGSRRYTLKFRGPKKTGFERP